MLVGEAVALLGIDEPDDRDLAIVDFPRGLAGPARHATLREIAGREIGDDIYIAGGRFARGAITPFGGRKEVNLREILWLDLDADLADFLQFPTGRDDASRHEREWRFAWLRSLPDDELWELIERLRLDLEEACAAAGVPLHRLDYTGYGLCGKVRIAPEIAGEITRLKRFHVALVARLNGLAGGRLVDPQVKDSGTRITRLVPCRNTKGPIPRQSRTLFDRPGALDRETLELLEEPDAVEPVRRAPAAAAEAALPPALVDQIVAIVAPSWHEGVRHALALALAGMLAWSGVPEEQTLDIIERLSAGDREAWDRARAVRTTYERVRAGLATRGFYGLRDLLPFDVLDWLDTFLAEHRASQTATLPPLTGGGGAAEERPPAAREEGWDDRWTIAYDEPPAVCFRGLAARYVDVMRPTTEASAGFHLAAILTVAGTMMERRIGHEYASDPLYGNLYTVLIGPTGTSRKDTAIKRALTAHDRLKIATGEFGGYKVRTDISSSEGIVKTLKEAKHVLFYLSEITTMLANARRQSTRTIFDTLLRAWDVPHELANLSKLSTNVAEKPYMSILAATQPKRLAQNLTDEDIHSGFANRWLFVPGNRTSELDEPPPVDRSAELAAMRAIDEAIRGYRDGALLPLAPPAVERWRAWYRDLQRQAGRNEDEDAMRIRHPDLARKLALIYAVLDSAEAIDDPHLEAAIALVEWMWGHVRTMLQAWGVGTGSEIERRVVAALERHGPMSRRRLMQVTKSRKWDGREFAMAVDSMLRNNVVKIDPPGSGIMTLGTD